MAVATHATVGVELLHPTYFSGRTKEKNTVGPREFIQDVVRRRQKNRWNDEQTMSYITGSLIGRAAVWFSSVIPALLCDAPDEITAFQTDFAAFKLRFCLEFGLSDIDAVRSARNYEPQRPGEDNFDFADRVYGMAYSSHKAAKKPVDLTLDERLTQLTTLAKGDAMPIEGADLKTILLEFAAACADKGLCTGVDAFMSDTVRVVLAAGLRDPTLKAKVRKMLLDDKGAPEIVTFLKKETLSQTPEGAREHDSASNNGQTRKRNGRNGNGNGHVSAVAEDADAENQDDEEAPAEEHPVDKVTATNPNRRQRGKNGKKASAPAQASSNKATSVRANGRSNSAKPGRSSLCDYCKEPNHSAERCFVKKHYEKHGDGVSRQFSQFSVKEQSANDNMAQHQRNNFAKSGNDDGLW